MRRKRAKLVVLVFSLYLGVYLLLSLSGAYMPATYGLNGIKDWAWTPRYFAEKTGRLRPAVFIVFFPLYWMDHRYWHNDWTGLSGPCLEPGRSNKPASGKAEITSSLTIEYRWPGLPEPDR